MSRPEWPGAGVVVIVVERNACVVALDEAAGRRVVVIGGEREAGVFAEVVDGLHQALAEGGFAHDQRAVVILQRAGDDFGRRSGVAIDQHDDGEGLAVVAVRRHVVLVGVGAAALRDDGLALGEQSGRKRRRPGSAGRPDCRADRGPAL